MKKCFTFFVLLLLTLWFAVFSEKHLQPPSDNSRWTGDFSKVNDKTLRATLQVNATKDSSVKYRGAK
ncbi:hypothetical protein U1E44_10935 [Arenibacter sp. GZD96]|uniref:hypothetical protein n=1 Tax=Aurantibrevibacter litoralis TaxID=3106030 RepID=UPI002AFE2F01|nr:hypothetical protein [Arenibacter sp. GZD-96]MEA1786608.1 hypothetical protein [Arenibacter sp. GZD-96]